MIGKLTILIIFLSPTFFCLGQNITREYPVIGDTIPAFKFEDVRYYSKKDFDLNEISGKWIILDFWYKGCVSCVQSFPKISQLQVEFKDKIQFLLIGKNDKVNNGDIEQIYDRYQSRLNLNLAIAFDTIVFKKFRVESAPHVVIIDPSKKVYAVTFGDFISRENIRALVEDRQPSFKRKGGAADSNRKENARWKYWIGQREARPTDILYTSVLSINGGEPLMGYAIDQNIDSGFCQFTRLNLFQLYNAAYWGISYWPRGKFYNDHWENPVLEIKDSAKFQFNYNTNTGFYNYSAVVPKGQSTKSLLMETMQQDLKKTFGYIVSEERRLMPCWVLRATEKARKQLITKGNQELARFEPNGIIGKGITIENVLSHIEMYNDDERFPFIDSTNIKGKIDITFEAVMTDIDDIRNALKEHGLLLEKAMREMKVIVVKDLRRK